MNKKPTEILSDEHKNILKVIGALEHECRLLQAGGEVDIDFFSQAIDFIRNYADKFHHAKEEDILFKEFCGHAEELHCNPVKQMLYEHDLGRGYVKDMEKALLQNNKTLLADNALKYTFLLKEHIFKEDNVLYPMADEALSSDVYEEMDKKFMEINSDYERRGLIRKYSDFANSN